MATVAQLTAQLREQSYTHGWAAIAAFDGAIVGPMLADYYSPVIHGHRGTQAISGSFRPYAELDVYCNMDNVVLGAPRISLAGNLQDSRLVLTYDVLSGGYNERHNVAGSVERIDQFINIDKGRSYTFSMEIDLAECAGTLAKASGVVQLQLGAGSAARCDLGSNEFIQEAVGRHLLQTLNERYAGAGALALGVLKTERRYLLPTTFQLRVHANPASDAGEFALVVLIAGPDGALGSIPSQGGFPYLIPDDVSAGKKVVSSTVLVSQAYAKLGDDAEQIASQLLFPNERYFEIVSRGEGTKDQVLFGRLQRPAVHEQRAAKSRRAQPGTTSLLLTRVAGTEGAVSLLASKTVSEGWTWELLLPELGELQTEGASATYSSPVAMPEGTSVAMQRIIAHNQAMGLHYEVCVVVTDGNEKRAFTEPMLMGITPVGTGILTIDFDPGFPVRTSLSVIGGGKIVDRNYEPPATYDSDIEVVVAEFFLDTGDTSLKVGQGYCIVQLVTPTDEPHWSSLSKFILEANVFSAQPYANGLQQLLIDVTIETDSGQPPVTEEEIQTLRLVDLNGNEVPRIPFTLEAVQPSATGELADWGWTDIYNKRLNLASVPGTQAIAPIEPTAARRAKLYLQTTSPSSETFAVRFTDRYGIVHSSNKDGGSEATKQILTVPPRRVPVWITDNYKLAIRRAHGDSRGRPLEDANWNETSPNFDWNIQTVDYWSLETKSDNGQVPFIRLQWDEDGPGVQWESEQREEDAFSYMGYFLVGQDRSETAALKFASVLYNPVLYNASPSINRPPYEMVRWEKAPGSGALILSLHRVLNVFWKQKALIPGFNFERPFMFTLWDKNGSRHRFQLSFKDGRHQLTVTPDAVV